MVAEVQSVSRRSPPKRGPRCGMNRQSSLTQALDLKDEAYRSGTSKDTPVHVKAALMRAWVDLQEMTMTIRGQGKPKPIEARNAQPRKAQRSAGPLRPAKPVEPPTPGPEPLKSS